jgi:hypothetical protein
MKTACPVKDAQEISYMSGMSMAVCKEGFLKTFG